jgi:hypothetical protein
MATTLTFIKVINDNDGEGGQPGLHVNKSTVKSNGSGSLISPHVYISFSCVLGLLLTLGWFPKISAYVIIYSVRFTAMFVLLSKPLFTLGS